jgi:pheromone shutdown protein TraB
MGPDFLVGEEVVREKCRCFIVTSGLSAIACVIATSHCTLIATAIFEVTCLILMISTARATAQLSLNYVQHTKVFIQQVFTRKKKRVARLRDAPSMPPGIIKGHPNQKKQYAR